jgi:hypothetical protein
MRGHPIHKATFSLQKEWPYEGNYCIYNFVNLTNFWHNTVHD